MKTAIEIFLRDKATNQNEKDLIKALKVNFHLIITLSEQIICVYLPLKDQDVARNLPGKVKVSAPNLMKIRAKK